MTTIQTSEFRHATNLLRGVSSLAILVTHYQHFFYIGIIRRSDWDISIQPLSNLLKPAYEYGGFAVQIFWCISGLILAHTYINQKKTGLAKFGLARFSRLYPLHLLTLLVVCVIQFVSAKRFSTFQIYGKNDLYHFFSNLFFVQSWGKLGSGFSFNAPTWSVSVEILVYFIFFALLPALRRGKIVTPIALLLGMRFVLEKNPMIYQEVFFFQCLMYFLIGVSIYFAVSFSKPVTRIAALSAFVYVATYLNPFFRVRFAFIAFLLVCCAAFLDTLRISRHLWRVRIFGELTYSVFLWHAPLQMIILMIMMQFDISHSIAQSPLFLLFFLALTYSVGYASYRWIEQPARKYITNRFMPAR
jgi:peptidoglycan/LPS O-acetylase OafA/YrhL